MAGSEHVKKSEERRPVINEIQSNSGVGRFLLFGMFLVIGVSLLAYFGPERLGEPLLLAVLGIFASIGVFFIFAMVLGIVQLTSAKTADDFSQNLIVCPASLQ